jgi:hypothetical protein
MIEDRLSETVLRQGFKTFERINAVEATIKKTSVIDDVLKDINEIPDILVAEKAGDGLEVFSTKSVKYEVEKIIKEHLKEAKGKVKDTSEYRVTEDSYISYVVVDIKDDEIFIESKDSFSLPNMAVGALSAEKK